MKIQKKGNFLIIDGKLHKVTHITGKETFEDMEFSPASKNIAQMIKTISEKLKNAVKPEEVIENACYDMEEDQIKDLFHKVTKQKTRPKTTKEAGCMILKVGGIHIPIR